MFHRNLRPTSDDRHGYSPTNIHKKKLNSQVSLQKGGSLLALVGLAWKKDKEVKVAKEALKKAKTTVTRAENKAKDDLYKLGVIDRREEMERKN